MLIPTYPYHAAAGIFVRQLLTTDLTTLYVSSLTWLEFGHMERLEGSQSEHAGSDHSQYALH